MNPARAQLALTLCLILGALKGLVCQELSFDKGIQHKNDTSGNWTADGRLRLTSADLIIFYPWVSVQVVSDVCSIDLRACAPDGHSHPTETPCSCTHVTDQEYNLHVSSPVDLALTDTKVQATVPSRYLFSPLAMTVTVGSLPGVSQGEMKAQLESLKAQVKNSDEMKAQLESLKTQVKNSDEMKAQLESLKAQVKNSDEMKAQLGSLKAQVKNSDEMKAQLESLKAQVKNYATQLATQTDIIKTLTNQISEISKDGKKHNEMTKKIVDMMSEFSNYSNTVNEIQDIVKRPDNCCNVHGLDPRPVVTLSDGMKVTCDTVTEKGGWVVIQRRVSSDVSFLRDWADYQNGFGNIKENFWFGLERIHRLTSNKHYELRIDFTFQGKNYFAKYSNFSLLGESENYKLVVSGYSGDAGDSLSGHRGMAFSTRDRDNNVHSSMNCATSFTGAWWYNACHVSNLNGQFGASSNKGMRWSGITGAESASYTEMKIRPLGQC